jgi:CBS domain-containing protein
MKVRACITNQVVTIAPEASTKEAFGLMKSLGVRHFVVVKEGVVVGIVTDALLASPYLRRSREERTSRLWWPLHGFDQHF